MSETRQSVPPSPRQAKEELARSLPRYAHPITTRAAAQILERRFPGWHFPLQNVRGLLKGMAAAGTVQMYGGGNVPYRWKLSTQTSEGPARG